MKKRISAFNLPKTVGEHVLHVPKGSRFLSLRENRHLIWFTFEYTSESGNNPIKEILPVWVVESAKDFEHDSFYWGTVENDSLFYHVFGMQDPHTGFQKIRIPYSGLILGKDLPGGIQTNEIRTEPYPFPDDLDQPKIKDIRREDQEADNKPFKVNASFTDPAGEVLAILRELPTGQQNTILNQVLTLIIVERKEIRNKLYEEYMGVERSIEALSQITKGFTDKIARLDDKEQA